MPKEVPGAAVGKLGQYVQLGGTGFNFLPIKRVNQRKYLSRLTQPVVLTLVLGKQSPE